MAAPPWRESGAVCTDAMVGNPAGRAEMTRYRCQGVVVDMTIDAAQNELINANRVRAQGDNTSKLGSQLAWWGRSRFRCCSVGS